VKALMPVDGKVEDAERIMKNPEVVKKLSAYIGNSKSQTKTKMKALWGSEVAEIFLPTAAKLGRPNKEEKSVWGSVTAALVAEIAGALKVELSALDDVSFWNELNVEIAANVIYKRYANAGSANAMVGKFRGVLKSIGVESSIIEAAKKSNMDIETQSLMLMFSNAAQENKDLVKMFLEASAEVQEKIRIVADTLLEGSKDSCK